MWFLSHILTSQKKENYVYAGILQILGLPDLTRAEGSSRTVAADGGGPPPAGEGTSAAAKPRHHFLARGFKPPHWLRHAVFALSLLPVLWIAGAFLSDILSHTRHLGSNPIKEAEHMVGKWILRFLLLSLAVSPAIRLTKQVWLIWYRRTFGLLAFGYACVHLLIYFVLDVELDRRNFVEDITDRTYITIGMAALLLLVPLALTSTKASIRRLGSVKWNRLHQLVFVTVILGNIHYWMSVKKDIRQPLLFAAGFAGLLGYRWIRRTAGSVRDA